MSTCKILHNPRCSKSRQTLQLLEDKGVNVGIIKYLEETPTVKQLDDICKLLNCEPQAIIRTGEQVYKELKLKDADLNRKEWLQIMVDNPSLIQRPIVINNGKAEIGRPPEAVLDIL